MIILDNLTSHDSCGYDHNTGISTPAPAPAPACCSYRFMPPPMCHKSSFIFSCILPNFIIVPKNWTLLEIIGCIPTRIRTVQKLPRSYIYTYLVNNVIIN